MDKIINYKSTWLGKQHLQIWLVTVTQEVERYTYWQFLYAFKAK